MWFSISIPAIAFAVVLAEADASGWMQLLANGAIGTAVLGWFMLRAEKKWEDQIKETRAVMHSNRTVANAIERNTQALMVAVLALKHLDSPVKELAKRIHDDAEHSIKTVADDETPNH